VGGGGENGGDKFTQSSNRLGPGVPPLKKFLGEVVRKALRKGKGSAARWGEGLFQKSVGVMVLCCKTNKRSSFSVGGGKNVPAAGEGRDAGESQRGEGDRAAWWDSLQKEQHGRKSNSRKDVGKERVFSEPGRGGVRRDLGLQHGGGGVSNGYSHVIYSEGP